MALEQEYIEHLRKEMKRVVGDQIKRLDEGRKLVRSIRKKARPLPHYPANDPANPVAFVAADGGNNVVNFGGGGAFGESEGALAYLVRVVDSLGNSCALEAMPGEMDDNFFDEARNEPMDILCKALGRKPSALSRFLSQDNENPKRNYRVDAYREIVEWAVLYYFLAKEDWGRNTMLVREGRLSSTVFDRDVFADLQSLFQRECEKRRRKSTKLFLVGISKQTVLLRRLSAALALENIFDGKGSYYAPANLPEILEFFTPARSYLGMGAPFFVRFGYTEFDPVWQVDVAKWQESESEEILGILANDARIGFPIPDFPICVQQAHHYANIGGLELAYIKDMMVEEMGRQMHEQDREKMLRSLFLREDFFGGRYGRG